MNWTLSMYKAICEPSFSADRCSSSASQSSFQLWRGSSRLRIPEPEQAIAYELSFSLTTLILSSCQRDQRGDGDSV